MDMNKILNGVKKGAKDTAKVIFGATLATLVADYFISPKTAQAADENISYCLLPRDADTVIIDRIIESKRYSFKLRVKEGETIEGALNGYATTYNDPKQKETLVREGLEFAKSMGYDPAAEFEEECKVPMCVSIEGCNPADLIAKAKQGPIIAEEAEGPGKKIETPENHAPTVNAGTDLDGIVGQKVTITGKGNDADNDTLRYSWQIAAQPEGANAELTGANSNTISFTPNKPGQYKLKVKVDDYRKGIGEDEITINVKAAELDLLSDGMNPAAIFNTGFGRNLLAKQGKLRYMLEAGPVFGVAERTDRDEIEIRDPMNGTLIDTITLEKILKTDVSGFYARAFAGIGDRVLLSLDILNRKEQGNFTLDGEEVSDFSRDDLMVEMRARANLYKMPGTFVIAGDAIFGYISSGDEATDDYGTNKSERSMYGAGAGLNLAYMITADRFRAIPGLGVEYQGHSGDGGNRSLLITNAGVYDISLSDVVALSLGWRLEKETNTIKDKELETELTTNNLVLGGTFGRRRIAGVNFAYFVGDYNESTEGNMLDLSGDVDGFGINAWTRLPISRGPLRSIGLTGGYKQTNTKLDENQNGNSGERKEGIGSIGISAEF